MAPNPAHMQKCCRKCRVELTETNWYPSYRRAKHYECKLCSRKSAKEYSATHDRKPAWRKKSRVRKTRIISEYGGRCCCCGDTHFEFLTIDHINGGGLQHRREIGRGNFYNWLKQNGYPKSGFRLLCMNCNFAVGHYGACPHQTEDLPIKPHLKGGDI